MAAKTGEFEQQMQQLEAEMKRLEAEYNMFFAGRLSKLPWDTRARVDAIVKRYDRMALPNTAQRFRFATLQSRYAKFCELWARMLKLKEEGPPPRGRARVGGGGDPAPLPRPPAPPANRIVHVAAFRNPAREGERLKELYGKLADARRETGEHPVAFDRLVEVVNRQVDRLGGLEAEVIFRVLVEDGKVTLTAKRREVGK
jgi:hypothetical protein